MATQLPAKVQNKSKLNSDYNNAVEKQSAEDQQRPRQSETIFVSVFEWSNPVPCLYKVPG